MAQEPEPFTRPQREERDLNLKRFLGKYLKYWHLFAVALVLALAIAKYYNWYQQPIFAVSAKLHVRDDNQSREGLLKALDMEVSSKNLENEIEVLRSFNILAQTLNRLEFDVSYYLVGDVKVSEVYKDCPFRVSTEQLSFEAYSIPFYFYLVDTSMYRLTYSAHNSDHSYEASYGESLAITLGTFVVDKRENFPERAMAQGTYDKRKYRIRFNTMGLNQNRYLSRLSIGLARPQSTILQVYLEDEVPQKGLDFVAKLIEVYLENDIDQKNKAAAATRIFIDQQLESITDELEAIELNRERFKVAKGIIDLPSESQLVLESIREMDQQRSLNNARIGMINQLESYVVDNADLRDLAPAALDISDPLLIRLINKLSELQGQRENVLNRSTSNDPLLVPLNAEIDLTRSSLLENIRNIRKGLVRKENELNDDIRQVRGRLQRIPTTERELLEIERRFRIQEGLYTFLLQKRAELSISLAAAESNSRLVDPARLLPGPIYPIPEKAYSIAILLGLLLPIALIFVLEKLNDTITDLQAIKRLTSVPVIGLVRLSRHTSALVVVEKPKSPIAEEYRNIRTNLQFFGNSQNANVIMVTSSVGTEGKTFTAMNLASVLAASGSRVVLVGLDLRKPRIVEDFGLSNHLGCSNYLGGMASLEEIIQPSGFIPTLDIVTAGPIPPNPSELIISERMGSLIEELRGKYDKVVLDTPPVGLVSDGLMLARHAGIVLFIVRYGATTRDHVRHFDELCAKGQLGQTAIVFNALKHGRHSYGFGYGYGYSYSYGGDYGEYFDDDEQKPGPLAWLKRRGRK